MCLYYMEHTSKDWKYTWNTSQMAHWTVNNNAISQRSIEDKGENGTYIRNLTNIVIN